MSILDKRTETPSNIEVKYPITSTQNHGLYIHIPFCKKKCGYCDFYSVTDQGFVKPFLDALLQEMILASQTELVTDTLYFGGGTPSILQPHQIRSLLDQAQNYFRFTSGLEITLEVNPGTTSKDQLAQLKEIGINRLNIGVQSFSSESLHFLDRIHTPEKAYQTIRDARGVGFDNIGLDLIFGIPGQDRAAWQDDLTKALAWSPEHLSCYMLTIENGTPLARQKNAGGFKMLPEKQTASLFQITQKTLVNAGYEQYEISNFARNDSQGNTYRSLHNQKYWSFAPYTGLGPSAHSYAPPFRHWNIRDLKDYITVIKNGRLPIDEREETTREQQMTEAIYLGLRTSAGININQFEEKFKVSFEPLFAGSIREFCDQALMVCNDIRCTLTPQGMLYHESIAQSLIQNL